MMKLTARISRKQGSGFRAWCPALPGCQVHGDTRKQARQKLRNAIIGYLASMNVVPSRALGEKLDVRETAAG